LHESGVERIVDVRTVPRSRANPQYNQDALEKALAGNGIRYCRIAELGGLRGRTHDVPAELNAFWENRSFHNYADYAQSDDFESGLEELIEVARRARTAIMCAEAVWWRCHRRIIADYLLLRGRRVIHLLGRGRSEAAHMSPAAKKRDGRLVYPAPAAADA
jgi:uncharacterized protein (DUF488 family)